MLKWADIPAAAKMTLAVVPVLAGLAGWLFATFETASASDAKWAAHNQAITCRTVYELRSEIREFSQLALDFSEVKEINVYALTVCGSEVVAVDAHVGIDLNKVMREQAEHDETLIIAPYPKKYVTKRQLKNGLSVVLRPIKPEDEFRFNELFKSLSQESILFRFFQVLKELSHDTLSRYCNLDYDREIAIVAEIPDGSIIGVVRLILGSDRKTGEFAIMVGDSWHSLGLGSKLMDYIIKIANDLKVEAIYTAAPLGR